MTESQIQCFLAVVQEQSISRAADKLYISQPAVSKQITLLETELEVQLFERKPQGVAPTDSGRMFEELFLSVKKQIRETIEAARNIQSGLRGHYYLGCLDGWDISGFCPELFAHVEQKYPNVHLHLTGYDIDRVKNALRKGEADGILTTANLFEGIPGIRVESVAEVRAVLLFSARHRLAGKEDLRFSDFQDEPFYITAPQGMKKGVDDLIDVCKKEGFMPRIEYAPTLSAVYMKLHSGKGAFLVNEWILSRHNPAFCTLPLDFGRGIGLVSLENHRTKMHQIIQDEILQFFRGRVS